MRKRATIGERARRHLAASFASLGLILCASDASAELPPVSVQGCDAYDSRVLDELIEFELAGLGLAVDELAVICLTEKVRARATVDNQALARDLDVSDLQTDDAQRFIGLSLVEMVEILNRVEAPAPAEEEQQAPVIAKDLVVFAPATPPPDRPIDYDLNLGVATLIHYQLGWSGPFAGVGLDAGIRSSAGFEGVADLQLSFRSLDLGDDTAAATNLATSLQAAWVPRSWISLGPGVRFGALFTSRDATGERATAYWGGLFARAQTRLPLFEGLAATFGVEAGWSPWTYAIRADGQEQLQMRGLFSHASFGAVWQ